MELEKPWEEGVWHTKARLFVGGIGVEWLFWIDLLC